MTILYWKGKAANYYFLAKIKSSRFSPFKFELGKCCRVFALNETWQIGLIGLIFYRWGNGGCERLSYLPKATELLSGRLGFWFASAEVFVLYYLSLVVGHEWKWEITVSFVFTIFFSKNLLGFSLKMPNKLMSYWNCTMTSRLKITFKIHNNKFVWYFL